MKHNENELEKIIKSGEPMDWVSLYAKVPVEKLPWFSPELDEDLSAELEQRGLSTGKFLDLGTGPGTQAIELAKRGFEVTGVDISSPGIELAQKRAEGMSHLRFVVDDIIATKLTATFDYIFDRGCFHVFEPQVYDVYLKNVSRLLRKDGLLFLKCFAEGEEMTHGPKCFHADKLTQIFARHFSVMSIQPSMFLSHVGEGSKFSDGHKALFAVMQRI